MSYEKLSEDEQSEENSQKILAEVIKAREIQAKRFNNQNNIHCNSQMESGQIREVCQLNAAGQILLKRAMEKLQLSARAYDRILKVARTIADLAASEHIKTEHIAEAIHFRSLDRENWAG